MLFPNGCQLLLPQLLDSMMNPTPWSLKTMSPLTSWWQTSAGSLIPGFSPQYTAVGRAGRLSPTEGEATRAEGWEVVLLPSGPTPYPGLGDWSSSPPDEQLGRTLGGRWGDAGTDTSPATYSGKQSAARGRPTNPQHSHDKPSPVSANIQPFWVCSIYVCVSPCLRRCACRVSGYSGLVVVCRGRRASRAREKAHLEQTTFYRRPCDGADQSETVYYSARCESGRLWEGNDLCLLWRIESGWEGGGGGRQIGFSRGLGI